MDPRTNPFVPGAGTRPPELAGREGIIETASVNLDRLKVGRHARSLVLYGLRGVGKTVLLNTIVTNAQSAGFHCTGIEAPEGRNLPQILVPALNAVLRKLSVGARVKGELETARRMLASIAKAFKVKFEGLEVGVDLDLASGDLEFDLNEIFSEIGQIAQRRGTAVLLSIDEIQYVAEPELRALIGSLHHVSQKNLPVFMIAAGLPQILGKMGDAKSYAERLFAFVEVGPLDRQAATDALCKPLERQQVAIDPAAVDLILKETKGYPYFLQEWGRHTWDQAATSPVTLADVHRATEYALAELDHSFFRVRLDRITPKERLYLQAMAALGPGPHRSGDIAEKLNVVVTSVAPTRKTLIDKGMIYSPNHGDTAFSVPMFDTFLQRTMGPLPTKA